MRSDLARFGDGWNEMVDALADEQTRLLRRYGRLLADGLDRSAQRDVEGVADWRRPTARRS